MALTISKRCKYCGHKLVENTTTKEMECKNDKCIKYVPDIKIDNTNSKD